DRASVDLIRHPAWRLTGVPGHLGDASELCGDLGARVRAAHDGDLGSPKRRRTGVVGGMPLRAGEGSWVGGNKWGGPGPGGGNYVCGRPHLCASSDTVGAVCIGHLIDGDGTVDRNPVALFVGSEIVHDMGGRWETVIRRHRPARQV